VPRQMAVPGGGRQVGSEQSPGLVPSGHRHTHLQGTGRTKALDSGVPAECDAVKGRERAAGERPRAPVAGRGPVRARERAARTPAYGRTGPTHGRCGPTHGRCGPA
jgi:hypothetical protein